jgi:hypothetical protein
MGGYLGATALSVLLITGGLAVALVLGIAASHRLTGRDRPYLDASGWLMAVYGTAALATWDVLAGEASALTVGWILAAVSSGYITGRRTCGQWIVVVPRLDEPGETPT